MIVLRGNPNVENVSNALGQGLTQGYSAKMNDLAYQQMVADRQQKEQDARNKIVDLYGQIQQRKKESEISPSSAMGGYDTQRRLNDEANALRTQLRQYGIDSSQIEENTLSGDAQSNWNKNVAIEDAARRYVAQNLDPAAAAVKARNFVLGGGGTNFDENMFNAANQYYRQQALGNKKFTTENRSKDGIQYAQDYMIDEMSGLRVPVGKERQVSDQGQWAANQQRALASIRSAGSRGNDNSPETLGGLDVDQMNAIADKGKELQQQIGENTITADQVKGQIGLLARKYGLKPDEIALLMGFQRKGQVSANMQSQAQLNTPSAGNGRNPTAITGFNDIPNVNYAEYLNGFGR
ncbi:hypothetical protein [Acetonema longum]|uniref:Uncharacterized protein n=1 Tax=Acetonema longum DSM 6540 TaxID=1009370 RepID=F7NK48_9FIRM|nr:hypothetical protein [Acetonema longum]EGO63489.1 hypothetical protein ALO_12306 [Acetonema longum DSM 6540]